MVYFVSWVLQGLELNYSLVEKVTLSLVYVVRRFRRYIQAHTILVLTKQRIRHILMEPERPKWITKWEIELGEYDISQDDTEHLFRSVSIFLVGNTPRRKIDVCIIKEHNDERVLTKIVPYGQWVLYNDGASSWDGLGAGIILRSPTGENVTYALHFNFECSNNDVEYEALREVLQLSISVNILEISVK